MYPMQTHPPLHPSRQGPPFMMPQTLQRGSACLTCRRRKLKCDAGRPACSQCIRSNKECMYDDGKTKTRTQKLQDRIAELEEQIKEMQTGGIAAPPLRTKARNSPSATGSSPRDSGQQTASPSISPHVLSGPSRIGGNGAGSSSAASLLHHPPQHHIPAHSHQYFPQSAGSQNGMASSWVHPPPVYRPGEDADPYWEGELLPPALQQHLLDVFIAHRRSFHFDFDVERLRDRLHAPPHQQPHPALMNAIWLIGCHYSENPSLGERETLLLSRARQGINDSLAQSDRLFQGLQASALVATYLYLKGRFLEAYHQTCSVGHFAVSCGLHQITSHALKNSPRANTSDHSEGAGPWNGSKRLSSSGMLEVPQDAVEVGERILTFWMIYLLDKTISITAGLPSALPDENDPLNSPTTVWPRPLESYGLGVLSQIDDTSIASLYSPPTANSRYAPSDTLVTLRLKVQALLERSARLSYSFNTSYAGTQAFHDAFQSVDEAIERFIRSSLPPLTNTGECGEIVGAPDSPVNLAILTIHTIAHGAMIQLHTLNASANAISYDKCMFASKVCVDLLAQIQLVGGVQFPTDSMLGHCWTMAAQVLIRQTEWLKKSNKIAEANDFESDIASILSAMQRLTALFPLLDFQVNKIQGLRAQI